MTGKPKPQYTVVSHIYTESDRNTNPHYEGIATVDGKLIFTLPTDRSFNYLEAKSWFMRELNKIDISDNFGIYEYFARATYEHEIAKFN